MERDHAGRLLHGPQIALVHKCMSQHRPGPYHSLATHASYPSPSNTSSAEARPGHDACGHFYVCALVLSLGLQLTTFSATLISIIRLYTIADVATTRDLSFENLPHATLSAIEVNTGIICACLPAMRPLLALLMPKYFSNVPEYIDIVIPNDSERNGIASQKPFTVITTARANIRINHPDLPRPTLSRTPSGRFATSHPRTNPQSSPRHTPPMTRTHSRAGSNISIDIAAADARAHARFQGRINPLGLSPIVPYSPFNPLPGMETYSRGGSGANSPVYGWQTPRDRGGKALPITPLPVPIEAWRVG